MKEPKTEMSIIEFLTKKFPDEAAAVAYFEEKRWGGSVECPHCGSDHIYKVSGTQPHKCSECKVKFTCKTGTIMEGSHVSVQMWLLAMFLMGTARKGISSLEMAKQLGVTQKTAWYMAHRIREACVDAAKLRGIIEVDEVYIGGKEKNKHANKKFKNGRGAVNKIPVVGMKSRSGKIIAKVVKNTGAKTLQSIIVKHVAAKSAVFTDESGSYKGLKKLEFEHPDVQALGLAPETAEKLGIGRDNRGMMKGRILFPLYEDGKLVGFAGYSADGIKLPPNLTVPKGNVIPLKAS